MITIKHKGDFKKTLKYLKKLSDGSYYDGLSKFGEEGVKALREATPKRTGKTAESWSYSIERDKNKKTISVVWYNSNLNNGNNIAVLIQYGHATGSGYYVEGVDYINPALRPLFDKIANHIREEVTEDARD